MRWCLAVVTRLEAGTSMPGLSSPESQAVSPPPQPSWEPPPLMKIRSRTRGVRSSVSSFGTHLCHSLAVLREQSPTTSDLSFSICKWGSHSTRVKEMICVNAQSRDWHKEYVR